MRQYIYWEDDAKDAYLFGTSLIIEDKHISFSNELIPSGNAIKTWNSVTNFQGHRIPPSLPLLRKGEQYVLDIVGTTVPENSLYLRVVFFNRFQEELSFVVLKDGDRMFTYPKDAYSYQIELVNAGMKRMSFDALILSSEEEVFDREALEVLYPSGGDTLHLLFSEDPFQDYTDKDKALLKSLGDVYVVSDKTSYASLYCDESFIAELQKKISHSVSGYKQVAFIGYGPIGNFAAVHYSQRFRNDRAYVTSIFYPETVYRRRLLEQSGDVVKATLDARNTANVSFYANSSERDSEAFQLVLSLISQLDVLKKLSILRK